MLAPYADSYHTHTKLEELIGPVVVSAYIQPNTTSEKILCPECSRMLLSAYVGCSHRVAQNVQVYRYQSMRALGSSTGRDHLRARGRTDSSRVRRFIVDLGSDRTALF